MLGGWASEEKLLDRLQKAAEKNLAKDPAAGESQEHTAKSRAKGAKGKEEMVVDDSGEKVPEATLRAEAAALG
jgi:hypothetical protein